MADQTGALAFYGQRANEGWDLALDAIGGKIGNHPVQYIKVQCATPAECTTATTRAVQQQGAQIILGTPGSALALAIVQEAVRLKTVYFESAALANALLPDGDAQYIWRASTNETILADGAIGALQAAYEQFGTPLTSARIMLVNESTAANHNASVLQKQELAKLGITPVAAEEYVAASTDYSTLAQKIVTTNPDVLIETSYVADGINLNKQLAARNWKPKLHLIPATPSPKDQLAALSPSYLEGIIQTGYPALDVKATGSDNLTKLAAAYKAKFGKELDTAYPQTYYSSARILFDVLAASGGKTDPDSFKTAALSLDKPLGSYANGWGAKFDAGGQNTRAVPGVVQWQSGNVCTVLPADQAACSLKVS